MNEYNLDGFWYEKSLKKKANAKSVVTRLYKTFRKNKILYSLLVLSYTTLQFCGRWMWIIINHFVHSVTYRIHINLWCFLYNYITFFMGSNCNNLARIHFSYVPQWTIFYFVALLMQWIKFNTCILVQKNVKRKNIILM